MADQTALTNRIDTLETRLMHQDRVIEDLNSAVTEQWRQIDALARQLALVEGRLQDVTLQAAPTVPEPPPPHY